MNSPSVSKNTQANPGCRERILDSTYRFSDFDFKNTLSFDWLLGCFVNINTILMDKRSELGFDFSRMHAFIRSKLISVMTHRVFGPMSLYLQQHFIPIQNSLASVKNYTCLGFDRHLRSLRNTLNALEITQNVALLLNVKFSSSKIETHTRFYR